MTEDEARAALAAFDGLGGLERWIAAQGPWQADPPPPKWSAPRYGFGPEEDRDGEQEAPA
jgi:hypothetical protein